MITFRDYQSRAFLDVRNSFMSGKKRPLYVLPTGGGKNVVLNGVAEMSIRKNKNVLILAHRVELIEQIEETARELFKMNTSFIAPGKTYKEFGKLQVGSVQTVVNRLEKIRKPDLIIVDEAHHYRKGSTYDKIFDYYKTWSLGLTATPCRLSGEPLGDYFDDMILGPTMKDLIRDGYLCDYDLFCPESSALNKAELSDVKLSQGDFNKQIIEEIMDKPSITGDAITEYNKYCKGKRGVVFCTSIKHAANVAEQFRASGIAAMSIDGKMDPNERRKIIAAYRSGEIKILTNCNIVTEGFDLPAIEAVIQLRPTASLSLYLQMVGRGLRSFEGKEKAVILDHVDNWKRHGLPDDDREWSLYKKIMPRKKSKDDDEENLKVCENCFLQVKATARVCRNCGHVFVASEGGGREVEEIDGDLTKIDKEKLRLQRLKEAEKEALRRDKAQAKKNRAFEQISADSYEKLVELGRLRGYQKPEGWALRIWQARIMKEQQKARGIR